MAKPENCGVGLTSFLLIWQDTSRLFRGAVKFRLLRFSLIATLRFVPLALNVRINTEYTEGYTESLIPLGGGEGGGRGASWSPVIC